MTRIEKLAFLAPLAFAATLVMAAPTLASDFHFSPEQPGRPRAERNEAAIAAIPNTFAFARDGILTVAISPFAPPIATYATDERTPVGADPDYAQLIADSLGRKLELIPVAWADWPLGLASGKYDAIISNVGVTAARKEKFDFSTYRLGLHGFYVKSDSPIQSIEGPKDVAGLTIITSSGTNQERILLEWSKRDQAQGLKPIELQYYDDATSSRLALLAGRADVELNPNGPQAYEAARDGKTRLVGTVNAGWPERSDVAVATRKGSGLAAALTIATNALIASGRYRQALDRWGLGEEALRVSEINPPGLPKY